MSISTDTTPTSATIPSTATEVAPAPEARASLGGIIGWAAIVLCAVVAVILGVVVLTADDSATSTDRPPAVSARQGAPASADAAERWLAEDVAPRRSDSAPASADAADRWLTTDEAPTRSDDAPASADAAERWLTADESR